MPDEGNYGAHPRADMPEPSEVEALRARVAELEGALDSVYTYCNDTLSGRADGGPDDRAWQREAVIRARDLARPFVRPEIEASIRARAALEPRPLLPDTHKTNEASR